MSTRTPGEDVPIRRIDRILALTGLGLALLSVISFFAILLARPLGVTDYTGGIWLLVTVFPLIALPVGFVMIIIVVIMSVVRRSRANRGR